MAQRKLKPTEIFDVESITHSNTVIQSKYKDGIENGGKWLMFIEKSKLDDVWENCCKLYDEGQLTGVYDIKCSTNYKNKTLKWYQHKHGTIRFYCGPAADQNKIMDIGRNISKLIPYQSNSGYMYFKSNEQTEIGNRNTGQRVNHLYKLEVGRTMSVDEYNKMIADLVAIRTRNSCKKQNKTKKDFK